MSLAATTTLVLTAVLVVALAAFLVSIAVPLVQAERALGRTARLLRDLARHTQPVNASVGGVRDALHDAAERADGRIGWAEASVAEQS